MAQGNAQTNPRAVITVPSKHACQQSATISVSDSPITSAVVSSTVSTCTELVWLGSFSVLGLLARSGIVEGLHSLYDAERMTTHFFIPELVVNLVGCITVGGLMAGSDHFLGEFIYFKLTKSEKANENKKHAKVHGQRISGCTDEENDETKNDFHYVGESRACLEEQVRKHHQYEYRKCKRRSIEESAYFSHFKGSTTQLGSVFFPLSPHSLPLSLHYDHHLHHFSIPASSPLPYYTSYFFTSRPLYVSLSTGFCGALTTFSSWIERDVNLFFGGQPGEAIWLLICGLFTSLGGVALGCDIVNLFLRGVEKCERNSHERLVGELRKRKEKELDEKRPNVTRKVELSCSAEAGLVTRRPESQPSLPPFLLLICGSTLLALLYTCLTILLVYDANSNRAVKLWTAGLLSPLGGGLRWWLSRLNGRSNAAAKRSRLGSVRCRRKKPPDNIKDCKKEVEVARMSENDTADVAEESPTIFDYRLSQLNEKASGEDTVLGKLNGCLASDSPIPPIPEFLSALEDIGFEFYLADFPLGTFLANIFGSLISCVLQALTVHVINSDNNASLVIVGAVKTGFGGSLSTVSTLMGEIYRLRSSKRIESAMLYALVTFITSLAFGSAGYAAIVWCESR